MDWYKISVTYTAIFSGIISIAFYVVYHERKKLTCAKYWSLSFALFSGTMLLSLLRVYEIGSINLLVIFSLNLVALISVQYNILGVLSWTKKPLYLNYSLPIALGSLAIFSYFLFVDQSITARIIVSRLVAGGFAFACVWAILYRPHNMDLGHWVAALFLSINGLAHLLSLAILFGFDAADILEQSNNQQFYDLSSTKISFILFPVTYMGAGIFYMASILIQNTKPKKHKKIDKATNVFR